MIEINLLPGQKRKAAGGGRFRLPNVRAIVADVTDPWLLAAIAAAVIAGGGNAVLYAINSARASRLENVLKGVRAEQRRFAAVVAQKHSAERVRDSLAAEMAIIRGIDADRYIWPHILDEITKALPAYTWITNIQAMTAPPAAPAAAGVRDSTGTELGVSIDGRTVDIEAYTTFLRQLAASPWLREVLPTRATTVIEQDRPVTEFNITARYRAADSLYIRTVPIVQSVR
jgi:Tfp pilus assembly protein PilN